MRAPNSTTGCDISALPSNRRVRRYNPVLTACGFFLGLMALAAAAWAGNLQISGSGGTFTVNVTSRAEAAWQTVIRQRYDYSCGSAAVATLLSFHYDAPVSEEDVFREMFRDGDQQKIRADGFSMLDLKRYLDRQGLRSDGFRLSLDKLSALGVPAIALVNTRGYKHFVVIRGIRPDTVLVADPAAGSTAVPRTYFEKIWNGVALAARGEVRIARSRFNYDRDWKIWPLAPVGSGVDRGGLGMFSLTIPGRNELGK